MANGALVLCHMHPSTVKATKKQLDMVSHWGICNECEVKLAEQVAKLVPSVKMMIFEVIGNGANMHATKLARAYTKRDKIASSKAISTGALNRSALHDFITGELMFVTGGRGM